MRYGDVAPERFWKGICLKMCTTDASPYNVKMQIVVEVSDTQSKRGFVQWTLGKLWIEVGLFGIGKVRKFSIMPKTFLWPDVF